MSAFSAARGVSQVMNRCEEAKISGFLDLSDCELMYMADALYMVLKGFTIRRCSLKNNKLKKFPLKLVANFPEMDVVNLEGNQLTELPEEIGRWSRLQGINLGRNRLTTFPDVLYTCSRLALFSEFCWEDAELDVDLIRAKLPSLKQIHIKECPIAGNQEFRRKCNQIESQQFKIVL